LRFAAWGLVCGGFLKGIVFFSGRGGGQWFFPMQNLPSALAEGGGTAGFAQLGFCICWIGGGRGTAQGSIFGAWLWVRDRVPLMVLGHQSI